MAPQHGGRIEETASKLQEVSARAQERTLSQCRTQPQCATARREGLVPEIASLVYLLSLSL